MSPVDASVWACRLDDGRSFDVRVERTPDGDWSYRAELEFGRAATGDAMGEADAVMLGAAAVARFTGRVPASVTLVHRAPSPSVSAPHAAAMRAMRQLQRLPASYRLMVTCEPDEDGDSMWCAGLEESPPDGGWPSRGAYFGHPATWPTHNESADPYRFDDATRVGVSACAGDDRFWDLVAVMVARHADKLAGGAT